MGFSEKSLVCQKLFGSQVALFDREMAACVFEQPASRCKRHSRGGQKTSTTTTATSTVIINTKEETKGEGGNTTNTTSEIAEAAESH